MKYILTLLWIMLIAPAIAGDVVNSARLVDDLARAIEENYVLTGNISAINGDLIKLRTSSEFTSLRNEHEIANFLTQKLQQHDKHFTVKKNYPSNSTGDKEDKEDKESWFTRLQRKNSGFKRVEILDGNIGYVDLQGFDAVNQSSTRTVRHAMQFIAQADAVIIDLRTNGGGSAEMVQLISSYFLPPDTHLNSFYHRPTQTRSEFRTLTTITPLFGNEVPVYVLISSDTFSAAEEFAYNMKHLKRAVVVGERSKGGANPWQWFSLTSGFRAAIPVSMAINPVTGTNWEGVGVVPQIEVEAKDAFTRAYTDALHVQAKTESNTFALEDIVNALHTLDSN